LSYVRCHPTNRREPPPFLQVRETFAIDEGDLCLVHRAHRQRQVRHCLAANHDSSPTTSPVAPLSAVVTRRRAVNTAVFSRPPKPLADASSGVFGQDPLSGSVNRQKNRRGGKTPPTRFGASIADPRSGKRSYPAGGALDLLWALPICPPTGGLAPPPPNPLFRGQQPTAVGPSESLLTAQPPASSCSDEPTSHALDRPAWPKAFFAAIHVLREPTSGSPSAAEHAPRNRVCLAYADPVRVSGLADAPVTVAKPGPTSPPPTHLAMSAVRATGGPTSVARPGWQPLAAGRAGTPAAEPSGSPRSGIPAEPTSTAAEPPPQPSSARPELRDSSSRPVLTHEGIHPSLYVRPR